MIDALNRGTKVGWCATSETDNTQRTWKKLFKANPLYFTPHIFMLSVLIKTNNYNFQEMPQVPANPRYSTKRKQNAIKNTKSDRESTIIIWLKKEKWLIQIIANEWLTKALKQLVFTGEEYGYLILEVLSDMVPTQVVSQFNQSLIVRHRLLVQLHMLPGVFKGPSQLTMLGVHQRQNLSHATICLAVQQLLQLLHHLLHFLLWSLVLFGTDKHQAFLIQRLDSGVLSQLEKRLVFVFDRLRLCTCPQKMKQRSRIFTEILNKKLGWLPIRARISRSSSKSDFNMRLDCAKMASRASFMFSCFEPFRAVSKAFVKADKYACWIFKTCNGPLASSTKVRYISARLVLSVSFSSKPIYN